MEEKNLTDVHNRRGNIEYVSNLAKANGTPYLAWPEDKFLLRVTDLPVLNGRVNAPTTWTGLRATRRFIVRDDADLREKVNEGFAYAVALSPTQHITGLVWVQEWKPTTRAVRI